MCYYKIALCRYVLEDKIYAILNLYEDFQL